MRLYAYLCGPAREKTWQIDATITARSVLYFSETLMRGRKGEDDEHTHVSS